MHNDLKSEDLPSCQTLAQVARKPRWDQVSDSGRLNGHFWWIHRGAGRAIVNGTTRGFAPCSAFYFPPGTVFDVDLSQGQAGWVVSIPGHIRSLQAFPDHVVQQVFSGRDQQAALAGFCTDIFAESNEGQSGSAVALDAHTTLLGVWLQRQISAVEPRQSASQKLMKAFTGLLEERYATVDSASDYARALKVTPTHLTRVCQQMSKKSATTLIQDRRLLEAKRQLTSSKNKIAQIAAQNGFGSAAYFTRLFSQKIGMTPKTFRANATDGGNGARAR